MRLPRRSGTRAAVALGLALVVTQALQNRPDPAAVPGVQTATVLQLQADAALAGRAGDPAPTPDAGGRAHRAAQVRRIWDEEAQPARLAAVRDLPAQIHQVQFVVTGWQVVRARPHRAWVELVGRYERREVGQVWQADQDRQWRIELTRGDPVGRTRGWRLLSVHAQDLARTS